MEWNQLIDLELQLAYENFGRYRAQLDDLTCDVSQLCRAWSKACVAARKDCNAVKNLYFLVIGIQAGPNHRAATHWELELNGLCGWLVELEAAVEDLSLQNSETETGGIAAHWINAALRLVETER